MAEGCGVIHDDGPAVADASADAAGVIVNNGVVVGEGSDRNTCTIP